MKICPLIEKPYSKKKCHWYSTDYSDCIVMGINESALHP